MLSYVYKFVTRILFKVCFFVTTCNMLSSECCCTDGGHQRDAAQSFSALVWFPSCRACVDLIGLEVAWISAISCTLCSHDWGKKQGSHVTAFSCWELTG